MENRKIKVNKKLNFKNSGKTMFPKPSWEQSKNNQFQRGEVPGKWEII